MVFIHHSRWKTATNKNRSVDNRDIGHCKISFSLKFSLGFSPEFGAKFLDISRKHDFSGPILDCFANGFPELPSHDPRFFDLNYLYSIFLLPFFVSVPLIFQIFISFFLTRKNIPCCVLRLTSNFKKSRWWSLNTFSFCFTLFSWLILISVAYPFLFISFQIKSFALDSGWVPDHSNEF